VLRAADALVQHPGVTPTGVEGYYTTVPNKTPTLAVIPMASAPQKVTRITLGVTLAPPANRTRFESFRDAEFVAGMCAYGVRGP
jgi:hypothetical protein